jgi:hypothetical protein
VPPVIDADLHALDVGQLGDRLLAEQDLRAERPDAQQLDVELLLQALVHGVEIGLGHLAAGGVIGAGAHQVQPEQGGLVA